MSTLDALLADLVGEGMGNIMGHTLVKGHSNLTSSQPGVSMPIGDGVAVRDDNDHDYVDQALARVRAQLGT